MLVEHGVVGSSPVARASIQPIKIIEKGGVMTFVEKLRKRKQEAKTMLCVGLDPDKDLIPIDSILKFNKKIIDETSPFVCAYKPNLSFYLMGMESVLIATIEYVYEKYPDIPVILDGKFGDTGNTSKVCAKAAFDVADAITVNPYLGQEDAIQPFLDYEDKGIFVLCHTSNLGSKEFQDLVVQPPARPPYNSCPLWEQVAFEVAHYWNRNNNCGLVVGATFPEQLKRVRKIVGDLLILVTGVGVQKGDLEAAVKYGSIINASRSVIYAEKPGREAKELRRRMQCQNTR